MQPYDSHEAIKTQCRIGTLTKDDTVLLLTTSDYQPSMHSSSTVDGVCGTDYCLASLMTVLLTFPQ